MPSRLARALRTHFAPAIRNRTTRGRALSRCAAEALEDRGC